jgi:hypothetical protein
MTANERVENARAEKEAREAVASRGIGGHASAVEDALKRYLASESFHELRREERDLEKAAPGDDEAES